MGVLGTELWSACKSSKYYLTAELFFQHLRNCLFSKILAIISLRKSYVNKLLNASVMNSLPVKIQLMGGKKQPITMIRVYGLLFPSFYFLRFYWLILSGRLFL